MASMRMVKTTTAYELAVFIDQLLHVICDKADPGSEIGQIADVAHADVHDLAASLSNDPAILATISSDHGKRPRPWITSQ